MNLKKVKVKKNEGLNRTSVGLKLALAQRPEITRPVPQSNQRGIETKQRLQEWRHEQQASIEPAWD